MITPEIDQILCVNIKDPVTALPFLTPEVRGVIIVQPLIPDPY